MNIQFRKTNLVRSLWIVTLLVLGLVVSSSAVASSGTMYISTDTDLFENHHGNIEIIADNVTLDCGGHTVIGSGAGIGIHLVGRTGVKVENCKVTNFTYGFLLSSSSNNVLEGNKATDNSDNGFVLQNFSNGNILTENTANNNEIWSGFYLRQSSNNILRENIASYNGYTGFSVVNFSNDNELSENLVRGNVSGFGTWTFSNNNRFTENVAEENSWTGFFINTSSGGVFIENIAVGNLEGFKFRRSSQNLLQENVAIGNKTDGYSFEPGFDSFDNTLIFNSAEENDRYGFYVNNNAYRTTLMFNTGCRNHDLDALDESSAGNMNTWIENEFCTHSYNPATTGAIMGIVTADGGGPLANIYVNACEYDAPHTICRGAHTFFNGTYIIGGLPAGDYRVSIQETGWAREVYDDTDRWDQATRVSVTEGSVTTGIDISLAPGGSISGWVTDEYGNPLVNMSMDLVQGWYGTCTDENGYYTIESVPLGAQNVVAGRNFCGPHSFMEQTIYGVTLTATDPFVTGIDFTLQPGGYISGVVMADGGGALMNIGVGACEYDDPEPFCWGANTLADGSYIIGPLPPGDYRVSIQATGWAREVYDDTDRWDQATRVPVTEGSVTTGIDISLAPGGSISGRVTDEYGNPLVNMSMDLVQGWYGTCTDENGYYTIESVPLGAQNVIAGRDFCGPHSYMEQTIYGVTLTATEPFVTGIDFTLYPK